MTSIRTGSIVVMVLAAVAAYASIFTVTERDRAVVTRFGEINTVRDEPGLYFKVPFIDQVVWIDKRLVLQENQNKSVQVIDSRRYLVDAITMYKVNDSRKFLTAVQANFGVADQRIRTQVDAALRETYGKRTFQAALSDERLGMMREIRDQVRIQTKDLGVEIVDVRIRRTDLPQDVLEQTYNRMQAERKAEAEQIRAIGNQQALSLQAKADRDYTVTLAESQRDGEIARGQGEAERSRIFAEVFQKDPEFFAFYRSMKAYETALKGSDTTYVLKPDTEFFKYFSGEAAAPSAP
ncbi:MAG: protease modulator HflC [Rhizobiales bacterium]|nr:protease modulator HflC [Hyphomicrobiales bacterium]MBI3673978.1 protease modulator HflC [Hyphomicrobiales bacterium]